MKLLIMSDLHLEMHADGGAEFIRSLDPTGVDGGDARARSLSPDFNPTSVPIAPTLNLLTTQSCR